MSDTYTPGDTADFHDDITTITDDDEPSGLLFSTPLEQIADNAAVLGSFYTAAVSGTSADEQPLTEIAQSGGYTKSVGNRITVPKVGVYEVTFSGNVTYSTGAAQYARVCSKDGGGFDVDVLRFNQVLASTPSLHGFCLVAVLDIDDLAKTIYFKFSDTGADANGTAHISIRRLR